MPIETRPKPPPGPSRASQALSKAAKGQQAALAKRLGIHQGTISYLIRGKGAPRFSTALVLERELGILTSWWAEPPADDVGERDDANVRPTGTDAG